MQAPCDARTAAAMDGVGWPDPRRRCRTELGDLRRPRVSGSHPTGGGAPSRAYRGSSRTMAASQAALDVRLGPACKIAVTAIPQTGTSVPVQTSKACEMERRCRRRGGHRGPGRLRRRPRLSPDRARCLRAGRRPSARLAGPAARHDHCPDGHGEDVHGYGRPGRPVHALAAAGRLPGDWPQPAHAVWADDLRRDGGAAGRPRSACAPRHRRLLDSLAGAGGSRARPANR